MARTAPTTRYRQIKAMLEGATSDGERASAQNALDAHVRKFGEPTPERPREPDVRVPMGRFCRWSRVDPPLSPELGRAIAPDGHRVLMHCVTVRKDHRCVGCGETTPKGGRLWMALAYNGNYRMHRLCCDCFAPNPKAPPAIEDTTHG